MKENEHITRAAGIVGGATLLSRILGFVRDMVTAYFFGAGMEADSFFVAFRIPNLLRRLFAEGALSVAFIPVFTEYLGKHSREEALHMARVIFTALALTLLAVTLLGELFAGPIVSVMAPGFRGDPEKLKLTVELTRIMFPYIFFIGLVALCMGVLNSMRHFAAPALAPVFLNVFMIGGVYMWGWAKGHPVYGLAVGVICGGAAQLALQVPFMKRKGFSFIPAFSLTHPALRRLLFLMGPAALGSAVYQLNILIGTLLASLLPQGSVSYLYYADRVVQFPLGVFAVALGTAALPSMSRHSADRNMQGLIETFSHSLRLVMFITIPASVGLIILREPIVELLFQRGKFGDLSTQMTARALLYYTLGLWAFSAIRILVSVFYAMQDTKAPVKVASLAFLLNIGFSLALMGPMKHGGLALATSLASMCNVVILAIILKKRLGRLDGKSIAFSLVRTTIASLAMGIMLWALSNGCISIPGGKIVNLAVPILAGILVFLFAARLMASPELSAVLNQLIRQRR